MTQTAETIPGRNGLLLPVVSTRSIQIEAFSQFFQEMDRLNEWGLYEGNEIHIPPVQYPDSTRLRPALLLRYAREALPEKIIDRNRRDARPRPDDYGRYGPYTIGHDRLSVMKLPNQIGSAEELVAVRRELRSQEVISHPWQRSQGRTSVYWQGKSIDGLLTAREAQMDYLGAKISVSNRMLKRTVKLFSA